MGKPARRRGRGACLTDLGTRPGVAFSRGANPGTGSKNPTHSCPGHRRKWTAFYAIAELLEFPDHSRSASALRLGTYRRTAFLVAHPLVQNQPKQSAKPMGDGPDGLLISQTRQ